jgi:hypothetical protein
MRRPKPSPKVRSRWFNSRQIESLPVIVTNSAWKRGTAASFAAYCNLCLRYKILGSLYSSHYFNMTRCVERKKLAYIGLHKSIKFRGNLESSCLGRCPLTNDRNGANNGRMSRRYLSRWKLGLYKFPTSLKIAPRKVHSRSPRYANKSKQ